MRASVLLILISLFSLDSPTFAQEPVDKSSPSPLSRPCSAPAGTSRKGKPKGKSAATSDPAACLEVKQSLVDLHEFFQSYVRDQGWSIDDERIAEDSWIFTRYLTKDELLQFAKEGSYAGRVKWVAGKVIVQVAAHELGGGFTRVEVSARFQGFGQNVDRFAPPRDTRELDSSGELEKMLISALEAHLKSIH